MLDAGDLTGFWDSRLERGDPWARTGAAIWSPGNPSLTERDLALAEATKTRLLSALANRDGLDTSSLSPGQILRGVGLQYSAEMRRIGQGVAEGHVRLVNGRNGLTVRLRDSASMHHDVFDLHRLPATTYGGTPIFGRLMPGLESRQVNRLVNFCDGCPE